MTATDELRRMLDERGVEWMDDSDWQLWRTVWHGSDGKQWRMNENRSGMLTELRAWQPTPEQAIEATLGRGTCHNLAGQDEDGEWGFRCSECGAMPKYGSGEVHVPSSGEMPDGTAWLGDSWVPWAYCPCCGRKVVDE